MTSQITGFSAVCSNVCWCADQRKHRSSASLGFIRGIHRSPFHDVTMVIVLLYPRPTKLEEGGGVYWIHLVRPSVRVRLSVCRRHGFRSISQVSFGISFSNFICMLMVAIGRSLLIFSDVTFKMAAWRPYCFFGFRTLTLLWLWKSTLNFSGTIHMYMGRSLLIFSNVNFRMAPWWPYKIFRSMDSVGDLVSRV